MRIAFDARVLSGPWSGVAAYTAALLDGLSVASGQHHYLLLFGDARSAERFGAPLREVSESAVLPRGIYDPRALLPLRGLLRAHKSDVYFTPQLIWPYGLLPCAAACTVHDVIPLSHTDLLTRSWKARLRPAFRVCLRLALARSARVFVDSHATLAALASEFGAGSVARCALLPPGVQETRSRPSSSADLKARFGILSPFLLYVGRQDPYKNLSRLLDAFALLRKDAYGGQLVLAGPLDRRYPEPVLRAQAPDLAGSVVFTGFVDDSALGALYDLCELVVQPSLVEGFGLTALEALAHGRPVALARIPSLEEVAGDAAIYFDPRDVQSIRDALAHALGPDGAERNARLDAGRARLREHSPERMALAWLSLLDTTTQAQRPCAKPAATA